MKRGLLLLSAIIALNALLLVSVEAHLTQSSGQYDIVVGWVSEPPITGQLNGIFVQVEKKQTVGSLPVEGLEDTLKVTVSYGGKQVQLTLRPLDKAGQYSADLIPTRAGTYSAQVTGSIQGLKIDRTWVMNETTDIVRDKSDIEFPEKSSAGSDVSKTLGDLQKTTADLQGQMVKLAADVRSMKGSPTGQDTTYGLAAAGAALGFIGCILGAYSVKTRRKSS